MKAVLISIQPKWCELIASGKKTVEVRKTKPKIYTPFKCYIYATHPKEGGYGLCKDPEFGIGLLHKLNYKKADDYKIEILSGKIIGEFVCDFIDNIDMRDVKLSLYSIDSCIDIVDLFNYADGKSLYFWHISDLVIYDKPKELREFTSIWTDAGMKCKHKEQRQMVSTGERYFHCFSQSCICEFFKQSRQTDCEGYEPTKEPAPLKNPPQSWCYVEEGGRYETKL